MSQSPTVYVTAMSNSDYELVVGLEVHVQLLTASKLFCGCSTKFGAPPNTQVCPVCLGLPGALPVMNRRAFELAMRTAVALDCRIAPVTKWDRKNYYYPDLPKGYQISQYDLPLGSDGALPISDTKGAFAPKSIGIIRVHLEEDAGKSMHDEVAGKADSRIDLNRAGTPLMEIVSQPDIRSPQEAKAYLTELKLLLGYLGVSDCNMQEGSLRVDANVNLHVTAKDGQIATPIVEVKNMNSFRAVERALAYEATRQFDEWRETGRKLGDAPKTTRGWDDSGEVTRPQRHKEESSDYRYLPDPDLVPVRVAPAEVEAARASLGELPAALRSRLEKEYGITAYDSDVLVTQGRLLVDYFVQVADACGDGRLAANWVQQHVLRVLNESGGTIGDFPISPTELGDLLSRVKRGDLDSTQARDVYERVVLSDQYEAKVTTQKAIEDLRKKQVGGAELENLCRDLLAANPRIVQDVKEGKDKAIGAIIGQARKRNANANPNDVRRVCLELIADM
jgi:aspartyl-tRNA(Asn)/glutamyl-tRNA(Gln) amidotransferase subunit B